MFMSVLDQTSVNLALPRIADHFAATIPEVQWVVVGYILATSSLLLPMGRLSDMVGRKRVYTAGLGIFALGAVLLSRILDNPFVGVVVAAMVMQGVGMGGFYSPNASAVLSTVERPRYGVATAFLNLTRTTANVTGVALATTIVTAVMASQGYPPSLEAVASGGGEGIKAAFTQGLQTALLTMTGFLAVAILLSSVKVSVGAKQAAPETKGRVPTGAQD